MFRFDAAKVVREEKKSSRLRLQNASDELITNGLGAHLEAFTLTLQFLLDRNRPLVFKYYMSQIPRAE
jgi:hypothetical protein